MALDWEADTSTDLMRLTRMHHLHPHDVGSIAIIKEGHGLLRVQHSSLFLHQPHQMGGRNLRHDLSRFFFGMIGSLLSCDSLPGMYVYGHFGNQTLVYSSGPAMQSDLMS